MKKNPSIPGANLKKRLLGATLLIASIGSSVFAQSNPAAQPLPYFQDFSGLAASSTTYPTGVQGWVIGSAASTTFSTAAATADRALIASSSASNNGGGCHNYNGKLGFLASGSVDPSICFAINTTGSSSVLVQYDMLTVRNPYDGTSNTRLNVAVLQYRVGTSGTWNTISGTEYTNNTVTQVAAGVTTPQNVQTKSTVLPPACDNQPVVQLRWASRDLSGGGGRPGFAVDNISAGAGTVPPSILTSPVSTSGFSGATATFQVVASGSAPMSYFWYKNSVLVTDDSRISGSTTNSLAISNLNVGDAADYVVIITNAYGSVTSAPATLSVSDSAPNFLLQPQSRSALVGVPVVFKASVEGSLPLTYHWQKNGVNLADNGRIVGSATASLTITNVVAGDAADYTLAVTNSFSGLVSSPATLTVGTSGVLVGWDFNGALNPTNPVSSQGSSGAIASVVTAAPFSNNVASGLDFGSPNNAWGTSTYPAQGAGNKTAGIQVTVSTVGFKNLSVSFDQRMTATSSRYSRLQYTTNGSSYTDYPLSSDINPNNLTNNTSYQSRSFNLAALAGVRNNPNFGLRVVTEFESTAKYGATTNSYVGNTGGYSPTGTVSYDLLTINAEQITDANTQPTIAALTNQTTLDTVPVVVNVTVGDTETAADSLSVTAISANHSVLSDGQISAGGSGSARTLTITPTPGQTGIVPILVTVTDGAGDSTMGWFYLTINPGNFAPTITAIPHTNTLVATPLIIPITLGDDHTAATGLTLSEVSFNTDLIPDSNIQFTGSGSNRTVTITPAAGQIGVAPITITVSDNDPANPKTASTSFTVMVRPDTNTIFNDGFSYPDGAIITTSFGLWQTHSGTVPGQVLVSGGEVIVDNTKSEDVSVPFLGQRFSTNSNVALYSSFKVRFTSLPTTPGGSYFAHFKDDNTGAATGFGARVWASTLNASNGLFRIGIGNGSNATNTSGQFPLDLSVGTSYTVVTKFVPTNGVATIWINPTSEGSTSVTATDVGTAARPNPIDVIAYAFRESGEEGGKAIDDLKVGLSFAAVTGIPSLNYQRTGSNIVFTWGDPSFALQAAPDVTGAYTNIAGATSPFTNGTSNARQFFRLKK